MKKLLLFLDNYVLKILVGIAIAWIALYPKLPSISITHTWVYIRLEDFLIGFIVMVWFVQLLRKKISFPSALSIPIFFYWFVGFCSLIFSILFIGPHIVNFFPKIAALQYARRIEYMILFFVGFSAVKNKKDILHYIVILFTTITASILYGLGQRFYLILWHIFPKFFGQNPFCFPAFLTGNEEFAKGVPLCLSESSRVSATFGGHYDLAAYLVFVIPIVISIFIVTKRWYVKLLVGVIGVGAIEILNFTASRTSFAAYLVGVVSMFFFWKRKKWILPVLFVSLFISLLSNNSVLQRFAKTVQPVKIITINTASTALPSNLQKIIKETKEFEENKKPENPPPGTVTIGKVSNAGTSNATSNVTTVITDNELKKLQEKDIAIATASGAFLIQKAYALDISFTTRFQAEWPRDWIAFVTNPVFGTGYSSLTLASDNDYLRALGETGITGFLAFLFIFLILGIYLKNTVGSVKDSLLQAFLFGLAGGVVGLLMNAVLIDVFEASKVAESLWLLLGIGAGGAALFYKKPIYYKKELSAFFTSKAMIGVYLLVLILVLFLGSSSNFFVGEDFTWLHLAAVSQFGDIKNYFIHSSGFFYRPLAKAVFFFLYLFFSFLPQGYHLFTLFLHVCIAFAVYLLAYKILGKKLFAFLSAGIFVILPSSAESIFSIAMISTNLALLCILYGVIAFWNFKTTRKISFYLLSLALFIVSLLFHESFIFVPLLLICFNLYQNAWKITKKQLVLYVPYILFCIIFIVFTPPLLWKNMLPGCGLLVSCVGAIGINFFLLQIKNKYPKGKQKIFVYGIIFIFLLFLVTNCLLLLQKKAKDWQYAGTITAHTLKFFRIHEEHISPNALFYFVSVPSKYPNALLFPSGLADGLWFIYQDTPVKVAIVSSIGEAKAHKASYIFAFDNKNMIYQIK